MCDFTSDPLTEALTENRILHRELKATRELLKGTREEIEQWKTWGIVEIAVRNPSVSEYMSHWEGRATKAETENDKLRGLLAQGKGDCVYCGLPAAEIAKCPSGFPGCARMDDIVNAPEIKLEVENAALFIELAALRWKPITPENLPKVGDEVLGANVEYDAGAGDYGRGLVVTAADEVTCSVNSDIQFDTWTSYGYTVFRPINPPEEATDGPKG